MGHPDGLRIGDVARVLQQARADDGAPAGVDGAGPPDDDIESDGANSWRNEELRPSRANFVA
jgi:hypothetical protein